MTPRVADTAPVSLDAATVEAIARRVVELMRDDTRPGLIDAAEVARRFGLTRSWVYDHADALGAIRISVDAATRPRLRFDPAVVGQALEGGTTEATREPASATATRRRAHTTPSGAPLLPIREVR